MTFNAALLTDLASTWGPWLLTVLLALGIKDIGAAALRRLVKAWRAHTKTTPDRRDDLVADVGGEVLLTIADKLDGAGEHRAATVIRKEVEG